MINIDKEKIKQLMLEKDIRTFVHLAQRFGLTRAQLSDILSERYIPIKSNAVRLADFFSVDPLEIIKSIKGENGFVINIDKEKIKQLMLEKDIRTFVHLAQRFGLTRAQLSDILSERYIPIKSNAVRLADFFSVDPLEIIKSTKDKEYNER